MNIKRNGFTMYIDNPPHVNSLIDEKKLRKIKYKTILIKYTLNMDNTENKNWWYCIKDDYIDIEKLKKKRRYELKKSLEKFNVELINSDFIVDELVQIRYESNKDYPKKYRPHTKKKKWKNEFENDIVDNSIEYWGVFEKQSSKLIGYSKCVLKDSYISLSVIKIPSKYKKQSANAALIYTLLYDYLNVRKYSYVSDGERNIIHETNFQDYLIDFFGFRKAYCDLYVIFNPFIEFIIKCLLPFRKLIKKISNFKVAFYILALLDFYEIAKKNKQR